LTDKRREGDEPKGARPEDGRKGEFGESLNERPNDKLGTRPSQGMASFRTYSHRPVRTNARQ